MKKKCLLGKLWLFLCATYLIVPLGITLIYSFTSRWIAILPSGFTFSYYLEKLTDIDFFMGILRGIVAAAIPVIITNICILLALFAILVYFPKLEKYMQIICMIPTTINGIILATSVLSTYAGSDTIFSNRIVMLFCTYCIFCFPLTYQGIRNNLYAVNTKRLLEASSMLGASEFYGFVRIIVPTVLPGLVNTALISFAGLFGDFAIIKIIASSQFETAQTFLYKNRSADTQAFSAGVIILLLFTLVINMVVHKTASKRGKGEKN